MSSIKKTLILHIGTHKTGTTSLQYTLQNNRDVLMDYGVYYLKEKPYNHNVSFCPLFLKEPEKYFFIKHYYNIYSNNEIKEKIDELRVYWKNQFSNFVSSKNSCFIISGEDLEYMPEKGNLEKLKEFIDPYFDDVRIVVYYREAKSYLLSYIQENIRYGDSSFDDFEDLLISSINYKYTLSSYMNLFGQQNISVRAFDRDILKNKDVIDDFLDTIGYPDIIIKNEDRIRTNEAIGTYSLAILSERNRNAKENKKEFRAHHIENFDLVKIMRQLKEPKLEFEFNFSKNLIDMINEQYKYINRFIQQDFRFPMLKYSSNTNLFPSSKSVPNEYYLTLIDELAKKLMSERAEVLLELYKLRKDYKFIKIRNLLTSIFIKRHDLFDEEYYIKKYKDITIPPLKHFILHGVYEGKNPNPSFDTNEYIVRNADVVLKAENVIFHKVKKQNRN